MSKAVINTHAGDNSDGKLWGIEGVNILLILAGLLLSVGLSLMLFRQQAHSAAFSFGVGLLPLVLSCVYVFALRQGRPRAYDSDLHLRSPFADRSVLRLERRRLLNLIWPLSQPAPTSRSSPTTHHEPTKT
jgi:hypothetical protein